MFGVSIKPLTIFTQLSPRATRLVLLGVLAGLSTSILAAGYLLRRYRRRYRGVLTINPQPSNHNTSHTRESSFPIPPDHTPFHSLRSNDTENSTPEYYDFVENDVMEGEAPIIPQDHTHLLDTERMVVDADDEELESVSSDDSFHSTVDIVEFSDGLRNNLYVSARELVTRGGVSCRKLRTKILCCHDDEDFLTKVHCIRLALDELVQSSTNRNYFVELGRNIMSGFLCDTNQDPTLFTKRFDGLIHYLEDQGNWESARRELTARKVVSMNIYDVALDFILLDAFDDLDDPPSTIVAVLQNRWITSGMKTSALSAAIWSVSKAKKSMLNDKNGFMAQFYSLSETISPTLAWGFLGTDETLKIKCTAFRSSIQKFTQSIFSLEEVRYGTVESLSQDILELARKTALTLDIPTQSL